jgi:hypothetical protein
MFPHEAAVLITGRDQNYEVLIDSDLIESDQDRNISCREQRPAVISVTLVKECGDDLLVELPRETVTAGRRIWVSRSQIERE